MSEPKGPPQGPPMTGMRPPGTASMRGGGLASRAGGTAMGTAMGAGGQENRPMTAVRAAGFTSKPPATGSRVFDPMNGGAQSRGPAPPLQKRADNSPEDKCREMEKEVNGLIEESAKLAQAKQFQPALDRAKEAGKLERQLCKKREEHGLADQINIDLTYSVCFNLANQYHLCGMYLEALNAYSLIVKNKQYAQSGRLRVNMGNIYYEQKKYSAAIKMYAAAAAAAAQQPQTQQQQHSSQHSSSSTAQQHNSTTLPTIPTHALSLSLLLHTHQQVPYGIRPDPQHRP